MTLLLSVFFALSAHAAGLGFNPFPKGAPTAPGNSQSPHPVNPSSAPSTPKPASALPAQANPEKSPATKPAQQPKK